MTLPTAALAAPLPASRRRKPLLPPLRMTRKGFRALVGMHAKLLLREPGACVFTLVPIALMLLFANIPSFRHVQAELRGRSVLDEYVPTFAAMIPLLLALTMLPVMFASFRERDALRRFSVSPVSPAGMLAALLAVVCAVIVVGVALIIALGAIYGVAAPSGLGTVIGAFVLGTTAVLALGLVVAAVAPTAGAANGMGLPLMLANFFFAGLYFPVDEFPGWLKTVGGFVPFGAVWDAWSHEGALWQHLLVLAAYTLIGSLAAVKLFRWQ